MRKENECCRHTYLEEALKIDIKNIYSIPIQYLQHILIRTTKKWDLPVFLLGRKDLWLISADTEDMNVGVIYILNPHQKLCLKTYKPLLFDDQKRVFSTTQNFYFSC